jgi:uncharacterized membrane protein HdeD (DUF308 family)
MPQQPVTERQRRMWGIVCILFGVFTVYAARTEHISSSDPRWPLYIPSLVFTLAGILLVERTTERVSSLITGIMLAAMAVLAPALIFSDRQVGGGIPFIPEAMNQLFGKIAFGFGAILCGLISLSLIKRACRPPGKSPENNLPP